MRSFASLLFIPSLAQHSFYYLGGITSGSRYLSAFPPVSRLFRYIGYKLRAIQPRRTVYFISVKWNKSNLKKGIIRGRYKDSANALTWFGNTSLASEMLGITGF